MECFGEFKSNSYLCGDKHLKLCLSCENDISTTDGRNAMPVPQSNTRGHECGVAVCEEENR